METLFQVLLLFAWSGAILLSFSSKVTFPKQLSAEEEEKYLNAMWEGDEKAKNILVERNLRLVAHIAKKYAKNLSDLEELQSIGQFGLIKAVNTFKADKNIKLGTYASRCIENEILMHLRSTKKYNSEVHLETPIGADKDGNEVSLIDILESDQANVEDSVALKLQIEQMYKKFDSCLNSREKEIIVYRYGLKGNKEYTQRELASMLGISRSYVSRIEKKALEKLKDAL